MLLGRLVEDGTFWSRLTGGSAPAIKAIDHRALDALTPSKDDKGWLSLYALGDPAENELVAAAITYNKGKITACHFVGVEDSAIEAVGLNIRKTPGLTFHPDVNDRHFEIEIPDVGSLLTALELFASGAYERVEQNRVLIGLQTSAVNDNIDLAAVVDKNHGAVATRTLDLVKSEHLSLGPATR